MKSELYSTLPDEMLGRLLYTGDEKAYETIYQRYWRSLFSIAFWKTNNQVAAEEMVQELFIKIWENRENTLIENLEAYLKMSLRYSIIHYIKEKLRTMHTDLGDAAQEVADLKTDTELSLEELSVALENALSLLPEKTRLVFQMNRFEQRSISEIANQLGLSNRAVEYHITQSLRLLRFQLKDYLSYFIIYSILSN